MWSYCGNIQFHKQSWWEKEKRTHTLGPRDNVIGGSIGAMQHNWPPRPKLCILPLVPLSRLHSMWHVVNVTNGRVNFLGCGMLCNIVYCDNNFLCSIIVCLMLLHQRGKSVGGVSLEGILSKSTLQGSWFLTIKRHRYGWVVVCRSSLDGLVKSPVTVPKRLCSHLLKLLQVTAPIPRVMHSLGRFHQNGWADWVSGDIGQVSSWRRPPEMGALWCAPSTRIGGYTNIATVVGAHMPFTYHVLTRPTSNYI